MMKTKHYEQVPSLHYWSQRYNQSQASEKSPKTTVHLPTPVTSHETSSHLKQAQSFLHPNLQGIQNLAQLSAALSAQSPGMFGYNPYFMPSPFMSFGNYPTNPLAAASMILSNPWLAQMPGFSPAMFPNFFGGNNMMLKPGPMPSSFYPQTSISTSSPPISSSPEVKKELVSDSDYETPKSSQMLNCAQCKVAFPSFQQLTEHTKYSGHFPAAISPSNLDADKIPSTNLSPNPTSSAPHDESTNSKRRLSQTNNHTKRARPSSNGKSSNTATEQTNSALSTKYLQPLSPSYVKSRPDKSSPIDFIKSLESTIQSAISKVADESSQPPKKKRREVPIEAPNLNHKMSFNPFSSMTHSMSPNHVSGAKRQPSLSPLDLSKSEADLKARGRKSHSPVDSKEVQSSAEKDHLKCIRDNMRSLFAYMNLQNINRQNGSPSPNSKSPLVLPSNQKCQESRHSNINNVRKSPNHRMSPNSDKSKTADANKSEWSSKTDFKCEDASRKRKGPSESILQDLFIPNDDEKSPVQNPLLQMENLVNHQLGPLDQNRKSSKRNNAWPRVPAKKEEFKIPPITGDINDNGTKASPMSALLNFFATTMHPNQQPINKKSKSTNGGPVLHTSTTVTSLPHSPPSHRPISEVDDDGEQLRIKMAYFLQSMANSRQLNSLHSPPSLCIDTKKHTNSTSTITRAQTIVEICKILSSSDQIDTTTCKDAIKQVLHDQRDHDEAIDLESKSSVSFDT